MDQFIRLGKTFGRKRNLENNENSNRFAGGVLFMSRKRELERKKKKRSVDHKKTNQTRGGNEKIGERHESRLERRNKEK